MSINSPQGSTSMLHTLLVWLASYTACVLKKLKKAFDSDLSHLPPLVYGPLPSAASIRIFDMIKPAAGDRNIIRLSTRIINLDSDLASLPEYVALSYTWENLITIRESVPDSMNFRNPFFCSIKRPNDERFGWLDPAKWIYFWQSSRYMIAEEKVDWNGDKLRWIEVDGCGVQVKENLFHFLETVQRVRKDPAGPHGWGRLQLDSGFDNVGYPLWIDAICINQDDPDERGSQVSLMSRVYQSAKHVLAWTGKSDRLSEWAAQGFSRLMDWEAHCAKRMREKIEKREERSWSDINIDRTLSSIE